MSSTALVKEYLRSKLAGFEHEVFAVLFLDTRHRLIEHREMFHGTIDSASVYPREVVKEALGLVEVRMLDQVIVAGAGSVSFSEQWLILRTIYTKKLSVLIHPTRLAFSNTADGDTRSAL